MVLTKNVSGQAISEQASRYNFFEFSLGGGASVMDNTAFDNWLQTNYHSHISHSIEGVGDVYFVGRNFDAGFQAVSMGNVYQTFAFYAGYRLTAARSPVTSFLNIGAGNYFVDLYNYAPVGFKPEADQVGQKMYLQYTAGFLSLQSRNYINTLSFSISRNRRVNIKPGFYVNLNFRPWAADWQYGYDKKVQKTDYDDDGDPITDTSYEYTSQKAEGVPALASRFIDAGVFIAITLNVSKRNL